MNREELKKYYRILGIGSDASLEDLENAYQSVKEKFAKALDANGVVDGETLDDDNEKVSLDQIEEAHNILSYHLKQPHPDANLQKAEKDAGNDYIQKSPEKTVYTGPVLKQIREEMDIELEEIARTTKIPVTTLRYIESENYESLPPEVYIKGFLRSVAVLLSISPEKTQTDYMGRYYQWKRKDEKKIRNSHFRKYRK